MDFARKQLEKYGWSDGKGLGKHESGISEALKPKLKRSVAGIGHDAAADFTEHWWKTLYDKAASNVEVEEKNGKTKKIKTKDESDFEITNSTWKLNRKKNKKAKDGEYGDYFVKKAVLTSGGSKTKKVKESESEDEEEIETKDVFKMTDEELFAACEGRTAHKGARHGLKALGKLARIEQQEQMLLNQAKYEGYSHSKKTKSKDVSENIVEDLNLDSHADSTGKTKKKKKKKYHIKIENKIDMNIDIKGLDSKKHKKKRTHSGNDDSDKEELEDSKSNKRKVCDEVYLNNQEVNNAEEVNEKSKNIKKKFKDNPKEFIDDCDQDFKEVKSDERKASDEVYVNNQKVNNAEEVHEKPKKIKKNYKDNTKESTNCNEMSVKKKKHKKNRQDSSS